MKSESRHVSGPVAVSVKATPGEPQPGGNVDDMDHAAAGKVRRARRVAATVTATVLLADQTSKGLAVRLLDGTSRSWGPVRLGVVRNTGGPFGLAAGAAPVWITLTVVGGVVAVAALRGVRRLNALTIALAVIAGGVLGNLVDRLVRAAGPDRGAVIDWLRIEPYPRVFNLADVALRAGALALVVAASVGRRRAGGGAARVEISPVGGLDPR